MIWIEISSIYVWFYLIYLSHVIVILQCLCSTCAWQHVYMHTGVFLKATARMDSMQKETDDLKSHVASIEGLVMVRVCDYIKCWIISFILFFLLMRYFPFLQPIKPKSNPTPIQTNRDNINELSQHISDGSRVVAAGSHNTQAQPSIGTRAIIERLQQDVAMVCVIV